MATVYDVQITNKGYFTLFGNTVHTPAVISDLTAQQLSMLDQFNWDYEVVAEREEVGETSIVMPRSVRMFFCDTEADIDNCVGIRDNDFVYVEDTNSLYKYTKPVS